MDHRVVVGEFQPAHGLQHVDHGGFGIKASGFADGRGERLPLDKFHAEKLRGSVLPDVVNLDNVVMRELRRGVGLAREASDENGVLRELGIQDFYGHFPVKRELAGKIDGAHPALPEFLQNLVTAEALAGRARRGHRGGGDGCGFRGLRSPRRRGNGDGGPTRPGRRLWRWRRRWRCSDRCDNRRSAH